MRFERSHTRKAVAVAVAGSLVLLASACGGDDGSSGDSGSTGGALEGRGPINFATGKDTSGNLTNQVAAWNSQHPDEKVTVIELPESADAQRAADDPERPDQVRRVQRAEPGRGLDRRVRGEPLDHGAAGGPVPGLGKLLPSTLDTAKYRDKLYAVPVTSDGGLLYYRKDLLDKAGVQPPKTWDEMQDACDKVKALPEAKDVPLLRGSVREVRGPDRELLRGGQLRGRCGRR